MLSSCRLAGGVPKGSAPSAVLVFDSSKSVPLKISSSVFCLLGLTDLTETAAMASCSELRSVLAEQLSRRP